MKNLLLKLLTFIFALTLCLGIFTACGDTSEPPNPPAHTHDYKTLKFNETSHWYECECKEKSGIEIHKGGTATCKELAKCEVCNELFGEFSDCNFVNKVCTVCGNKQGSEGLEYESVTINGIEGYSVTGIGSCQDSEIVIPKEHQGKLVLSIGDHVFHDCDSLESIVIPNSVTSIGALSFYNCASLTSLKIVNGVTSIGYGAFAYCSSLTSIEIPNSVTSIGDHVFHNCDSLTSVVIPNSVTSIGYEAFYSCTSLERIVIPNSVTSIGDSAFYYCTSLTSITVEENNPNYKSIDGNLYSKDGKTLIQYAIGKTAISFEIPNSVTSIGDYAFENCTSLTSIVIPKSVTSIGYGAFAFCTSLTYNIKDNLRYLGNNDYKYLYLVGVEKNSITTATIDSSCKFIGEYAFSDCYSLKSIEIPNSVTSIGENAFSYCGSLKSIEIPNSVTSIGSSAFSDCYSLKSIKVDENNANYKSIDGNLYSKDGKTLIQYAIGKTTTSFDIPNSVTSIGDRAFSNCDSLKSIVIPNSVTSIGDSAFRDCTSLESITIPDSVTSIGEEAFSNCSKLTSITIPDSVTSIGNWAFEDCTSLTIYCKAESKPGGWSGWWNYSNRPVEWGYKGNQIN